MKKITALVLALVMTLSLLPMNVWAAGESGSEMQEQRNNASTPTDYKPLYYFDGDNYHAEFNVNITGNSRQFRCATEKDANALVGTEYGYDNSNLTTEGNVGTFTCNQGDCVWTFASATDVEGYLRVEKDDTVYRMKVTINNGRNVFTYQGVDVYTSYDNGNLSYGDWRYDDLELTINGGKGISMLVPYIADAETTTASVYLKPAAGLRLVLPSHRESYTTLSSVDNNGVYVLTSNDLPQNTSVQVFDGEQCVGEIDLMFVPRDSSSGGNEGGNEIMRSNKPVVSDDILPMSAMPTDFETVEGFGKVQIPGTDYFMSLIRSAEDVLQDVKIDGMGIPERAQDSSEFAIGFWKRDGQQWLLLEGAELTNLVAAFDDTLDINLKLYTDDADNDDDIEYPYTRPLNEANLAISPYPCCAEYVFNSYSQGHWLVVVSGTYNGSQYVESLAYLNREEQVVRGIDATGMSTVDQINEAIDTLIAGLGEGFRGRIAVDLPAATLEGYIEVPACKNTVILSGQTDANGNLLTVLKGGIIANNSFCRAEDIRFTGAGRNVTTGNYAITGKGSGGFEHCSFTGYHYAIYLTNGIAAGKDNFFYNNNVAYRVDDPDVLAIGNHEIYNTVFAYNGTDIEIDNADNTAGGPRYYKIWDAIFIGSEQNISVDDTLREILFMPKNAFDDGLLDNNNLRVDEPKVAGNVSATPYYGLSDTGKDSLYGLLPGVSADCVNSHLANPAFNEDWIDRGRRFNSEWMCPERPDDRDLYTIPGDTIRDHHGKGHDMTIKIMGERNDCHEHVATITLKKAD